ncbi:MAG TPA: hypothetical protein VFM46_06645, partial [Pseudomonadales bacterium]|nr:hypothetical protein [Pseudomonadales bacterium]
AAKAQLDTARQTVSSAAADLNSNGLELGWKKMPSSFSEYLSKLAGLFISIVAISLGAPFWFSLLQRFMQVRASGLAPAEKK